MTTTTFINPNLVNSLRNAIVPKQLAGGNTAEQMIALARHLIDAAHQIDQTGGMNPPSASSNIVTKTAMEVLDIWRPAKMLEASPEYVRAVEALVRDVVLFVCRPGEHAGMTKPEAVRAMATCTMAGIDGQAIVGFITHIREHGRPLRDKSHKTPRPASPKTCNDYIAALRSFFKQVMGIEGSGVGANGGGNPCEQVKWVNGRRRGGDRRGKSRTMRAVTAAEARAIILTAPREWSEWYRGDAEVGMRAGAFEKLLPSHFDIRDFDNAWLRPTPDLSRKRVAEEISISPELAAIVAERIERNRLQGKADGAVFGRRPHRETFMRHLLLAGVAHKDERGRTLGLHGFRRFMATEMLRRGVAPRVVQDRMGHANIEMTMRYADHTAGDNQEGANRLRDALEGLVSVGGEGRPAAGAAAGWGASMAGATGHGLVLAQGASPRGVKKTQPYQLACGAGQWALQGSNHVPSQTPAAAPIDHALQETVYRAVKMALSGLSEAQVAAALRAIAAEAIASAEAPAASPAPPVAQAG
jgi:integrase